MLPQESNGPVDPAVVYAGQVEFVAEAREDLRFRRRGKHVKNLAKECQTHKSPRLDQPLDKRAHGIAGEIIEKQAAVASVQQWNNGFHFRHRGGAIFDELFRKLNHERAGWNDLTGCNVRDPVLRQIGACHDQLARLEAADKVAYIEASRRRYNEVNFIFRM